MLILDFIPDFINWINEFKHANYLVKIMIMKHFLFTEINIVKKCFFHLTWNKYHVQVELSPIDMAAVNISIATAKRFLKLNLLSHILYCARPWNVKQKKHNNRKSENAMAKALLLAACFFLSYSLYFFRVRFYVRKISAPARLCGVNGWVFYTLMKSNIYLDSRWIIHCNIEIESVNSAAAWCNLLANSPELGK